MGETIFIPALVRFFGIFNPGSRIFVLYLITALVLAFIAYLQVEKAHDAEDRAVGIEPRKRTGFFAYIFDPKVWLHPSSRQDFKYFAVNCLLYYGLIVQFMVGTEFFTNFFVGAGAELLGEPSGPVISGVGAIISYTIVSVLAFDFGVFFMHYLFHRIPVFWQFHKVHHSAEQLNIMTLFRMHPIDLAMTSISVMFFQSLAYAGFFYLTDTPPEPYTVMGLNVVIFAFYLFGYNLRHSHVWVNYPKWLNRILISPAQHQIHHSSDPKHFDRNMGLIFSFWDQLFGTHYNPGKREELNYGLSRAEPNPFETVYDLYAKPFGWAAQICKERLWGSSKSRSVVYASALATLTALTVVYWDAPVKPDLPDIRLERMTWTQVETAIKDGHRDIIIPTGGTEQNGPFVILGKHNIIAADTSLKIAKKVGNTLIAPVMAYVPEGNIEPGPTGHMKFAGTISLPEATYEAVLEATIRSLKVHGFKRIYIMGESGDSQAAQIRVAERLDKAFKDEGVRVANLGDYYYENGQMQYLQDRGYTRKQIGTHAGMRDASEVMALDPSGVMLTKNNILEGRDPGSNGAVGEFSPAIGKTMLGLKVKAGARQIRELRKIWGPVPVEPADTDMESVASINKKK